MRTGQYNTNNATNTIMTETGWCHHLRKIENDFRKNTLMLYKTSLLEHAQQFLPTVDPIYRLYNKAYIYMLYNIDYIVV